MNPEAFISFLTLEARIIPHFGARIHPGFSEDAARGAGDEVEVGTAGRCRKLRRGALKSSQMRANAEA